MNLFSRSDHASVSSSRPARTRWMAAAVAGQLSLTALLAGCGSPSPSAALTASKDTAGAQAYTIKHAMGETKIAGTPKRVVILTNEGTEALFALGVKPVGAVKSWSGNPWYEHLTKRMEGVEMVGDENQPNLEAIAKLKPDLILGNKLRQEKVYPQLSAIAPTVFTERLQSDWQKNFKVYAEALGLKAEGDKLLAQYDQRIADMKAKAGDSLKTKVSLVRFIPGKTRLYMKDTFAGFALDRIGFARPDAQNRNEFMQEITKERIPDMDGDVIFYFTWDNDKKEASAAEKEWTTDPLWTNLNAVKKGKAFRVSDDIWNSSGGIIAANLMLDDVQKYLLKP